MTDMHPTPEKDREPGTSDERKLRRLRVALIWSLAVNLLVLGVIGGAVLNFRKSGSDRASMIDGPNPFLRALTREDARALRGAVTNELGALADRRAQAPDNMQALLAELRSDAFSAEGLIASFTALNAGNVQRAEIGNQAILDHLLTMDAEGRKAFADRLEAGIKRGPRGGPRGERPARRDQP